jgi:hypothetical protein
MTRIPGGGAYWVGELEAKTLPLKIDEVKIRLSQANVPEETHEAIIADLDVLPMKLQEFLVMWNAGGDAAAVRDHIGEIRKAARELKRLLDAPLSKPAKHLAMDYAARCGHFEYYETVEGLTRSLQITDTLFRFVQAEIRPTKGGDRTPHAGILAGWTVVVFHRHGLPIDSTRNGLLTQIFERVLKAANVKIARPDAPLRRAIRDLGLG